MTAHAINRPVLIGCSVHWRLKELREDLATRLVASHVGFGDTVGRLGGIRDADAEKAARINRLVADLFADIGRQGYYDSEKLNPIIDEVLNVETVFLHTALATGADSVLYHGDDTNTPKTLNTELCSQLLGNRFQVLDPETLNRCRAEVSELFPSVGKIVWDESLSWNERKPVVFMSMTLIDILVSIRTNARLILFNPEQDLAAASRTLPIGDLLKAAKFIDLFERLNGRVVLPSTATALAGIRDAAFFSSDEYIRYCEAHEQLGLLDTDHTKAIGQLARTVTTLTAKYDRFVQASAVNLVTAKALDKILSALTAGVSSNVKDFLGVLVALCKARNRSLAIYSGVDLKNYCEELLMQKAYGPKRSWLVQKLIPSSRLGLGRKQTWLSRLLLRLR